MPAQLLHISDSGRRRASSVQASAQRKPARLFAFPSVQTAAKPTKRYPRTRRLLVAMSIELVGMLLIGTAWAVWHVVRH